MNHTIVTRIGSLVGNRPWKAPTFEGVIVIDEHELTELGRDRRDRQWLSHRSGELLERDGLLDPDRDLIPDGYVALVDAPEGRRYRAFGRPLEPGSFERATQSAQSRAERAPRPQVIDGLAGPNMLNTSTGIRVRGPAAILARLESKGYTVRLAADSEHLVVTSDRGRYTGAASEALSLVAPLLVGYLRNEPVTCSVTRHAPPTPAVTVALGGAAWCGECGS